MTKLRCRYHPSYTAKGKPRGACPGCWYLWLIIKTNDWEVAQKYLMVK